MVKAKNGKVKVTGRLLQINGINMAVKEFPNLSASVEMTGYALPVGSTIAAGATSDGPAGAATGAVTSGAASTSAGSTAATGGPPVGVIGVK